MWGDLITVDHLVQRDTDIAVGITGDKDALTIRDLFTGWLTCYPMKERSMDNTEDALRDFAGGFACLACMLITPVRLKERAEI